MSVGERILKIGQYLEKLEAKNILAPFPRHGVLLVWLLTVTADCS